MALITREVRDQLREEFRGHSCPALTCRALKREGDAFCRKCYFSLPKDMQRALWRPVGHVGSSWRQSMSEKKINICWEEMLSGVLLLAAAATPNVPLPVVIICAAIGGAAFHESFTGGTP